MFSLSILTLNNMSSNDIMKLTHVLISVHCLLISQSVISTVRVSELDVDVPVQAVRA